jgi:RecG-like helicase
MRVEPVYGLTNGITNGKMRALIEAALDGIENEVNPWIGEVEPGIVGKTTVGGGGGKSSTSQNKKEKSDRTTTPSISTGISDSSSPYIVSTSFSTGDWLDADYRGQQQWPSFIDALKQIHSPRCSDDLLPSSAARCRIAFDELVAQYLHQYHYQQLADGSMISKDAASLRTPLSSTFNTTSNTPSNTPASYSIVGSGEYTTLLESVLPFKLLKCQTAAIEDIYRDMEQPRKMEVSERSSVLVLLHFMILSYALLYFSMPFVFCILRF